MSCASPKGQLPAMTVACLHAGFDAVALCVSCWALCVLGQTHWPHFQTLWDALAARWAAGRLDLTARSAGQVYQVIALSPVQHTLQVSPCIQA